MAELSLHDTHKLRFMQTKEAEEYLASLGFSPEAIEELRPIIGRSLHVSAANPDLDNSSPLALEAITKRNSGVSNLPRRMLIATLWILGGSNNKIARLLNVTNQTVFAHVNRILPPGSERHKIRIRDTTSYEALEWYFSQWLKYAGELGHMNSPQQMADWLHTNHPYPG